MSLGKTPWYLVLLRGALRWGSASLLSSSFQNVDQKRHSLLCPVRALNAYVHRAALWRKKMNSCLYVLDLLTRGPLHLSKGWASGWSRLAYESAGQPSPMAVRSHSTRSMVASKALISGVALQEVCDAAGWSSPHTFVRFYLSIQSILTVRSHVLRRGQILISLIKMQINL